MPGVDARSEERQSDHNPGKNELIFHDDNSFSLVAEGMRYLPSGAVAEGMILMFGYSPTVGTETSVHGTGRDIFGLPEDDR